VIVAADGEPARRLEPGEVATVRAAGARVRYLAVRGGIDVPLVLGGRGTLLVAGIGGHEGRALRAGDVLRAGAPQASPGESPAPPDPVVGDGARGERPIRVVPGPDLDRFAAGALEVLLGSTFAISPRSDRTGVRLCGPAIERADDDAAVSAPMVLGAIQVPASGEPIVLGPDHPTTGGYPVIATVIRSDVGRLMDGPPGATVRFGKSEARNA
jgi:biotin-dependent carboxylase-like uncharacterized protein